MYLTKTIYKYGTNSSVRLGDGGRVGLIFSLSLSLVGGLDLLLVWAGFVAASPSLVWLEIGSLVILYSYVRAARYN